MWTLDKVKELWGQWSWGVFAFICIVLATLGTIGGGRATLICAGIGVIIANWMYKAWSTMIYTPPMSVAKWLKGIAASAAMIPCTISLWGYVAIRPTHNPISSYVGLLKWTEYGLGVVVWVSGILVLIAVGWHLLRLAVTHSLK